MTPRRAAKSLTAHLPCDPGRNQLVSSATTVAQKDEKHNQNLSSQWSFQLMEGGEEAAVYEKYLRDFQDPGMLKMAHIAYGFNPGAKLTGNIVEDERVWGSTEWGIGYVSNIDAPPCGQDAVSHSDGICLNSSVWLDGVQIMDQGEIVLPELVELMPKR